MELTSDDGSVLDDLDENLADSSSSEYKRSLMTVMTHFNNFMSMGSIEASCEASIP